MTQLQKPTVEIGTIVTKVPDEIMDNITWAVNQLRNVECRPVTVESVYRALFYENIICGKDTIKSALLQIGYRL